MTTPAYVVRCDGRKNGPGSAYLVATPEPTRTPAPRTVRDLAAGIRAALDEFPMTMTEIAEQLGVTTAAVNGALWQLRQQGQVVVVGERPRDARRYGRSTEYLYGRSPHRRAE
jgi:predicted ArsR family transcriptional regulator